MATDPQAHANHDAWSAIPGTPFEIHQASGTNVAVHLVDGDTSEICFDVDGPVRLRMNLAGGYSTVYGVRMHPNPACEEKDVPRVGASVSQTVGEHAARESAKAMNALASGPEGNRYWVLLAEVVVRERIQFAGGGEVLTPWRLVADSCENGSDSR